MKDGASLTRSLGRLARAGLPVAAAAAIGSAATLPAIPTWYATLAKVPGTPPNWVFGPVWTVLYGFMAVAAWRILRVAPGTPWRRWALSCFYGQLVLNALWSVVFFGLRSPVCGLAVIVLLYVAISATARAFRRLDRPSAHLLAPYRGWVLYAAYLNGGIWWLNR